MAAVILYYLGQQPAASLLSQIQSVQHCASRVTPAPGRPDWLCGVMSVSGELLPLLDLSTGLNLPDQHSGKPAALLVCQMFQRRYGVLVSRCTGCFDASPVVSQETTDIAEFLLPYVTGQVQVKETICPLLDLTTLYPDPKVAERS